MRDLGKQFLNQEVLAKLMAQPLLARLPMEGSVSGQHKSPHRGSSVEFAEYRNYVPGDDLRRLDWRVLGRTDRNYMKEYDAETNLRCYFILDCSASMKFAGKHGSKIDYAKRLIATLAYLVVHQGDAAGLICVGEKKVFEIPARRNPSHLQLIFETLDKAKPQGKTGLPEALHELAESVRRRALVVVFSDLFSDPETVLGGFQHVRYQKHDLAVFHLVDRMELDFEFDRPVRFVDLENSLSLVTEPAAVRQEYLRQINVFLEQMRLGCHEYHSDYRRVETDQDYGNVLADFLGERARLVSASPF